MFKKLWGIIKRFLWVLKSYIILSIWRIRTGNNEKCSILNLGCNKNVFRDGSAINIDLRQATSEVLYGDVRNLWFLVNESVESIYALDILEHLSVQDGLDALAEWYRVLDCGGTIVLTVPDAQILAHKYLIGDYSCNKFRRQLMGEWGAGEGPAHKNIFDMGVLRNWLKEAGFQSVMVKHGKTPSTFNLYATGSK